MKSCGLKHSIAVKRGIRRLRETPPNPTSTQMVMMESRASNAAQRAGVASGINRLLGKLMMVIPDPDELENQLRQSYRRGYLQALNDARREGWRQELYSYQQALPVISRQEAVAISHAYGKGGVS